MPTVSAGRILMEINKNFRASFDFHKAWLERQSSHRELLRAGQARSPSHTHGILWHSYFWETRRVWVDYPKSSSGGR